MTSTRAFLFVGAAAAALLTAPAYGHPAKYYFAGTPLAQSSSGPETPGAQDANPASQGTQAQSDDNFATQEGAANERNVGDIVVTARRREESLLDVPIAVSAFTGAQLEAQGLVGLRYVDGAGAPTEVYPLNPNGSPGGITGVQTPDGRVLALMPHPERVVALESNSWYPPEFAETWKGVGPWFRMFQSARKWCGE